MKNRMYYISAGATAVDLAYQIQKYTSIDASVYVCMPNNDKLYIKLIRSSLFDTQFTV